jgi:hypothetical protein
MLHGSRNPPERTTQLLIRSPRRRGRAVALRVDIWNETGNRIVEHITRPLASGADHAAPGRAGVDEDLDGINAVAIGGGLAVVRAPGVCLGAGITPGALCCRSGSPPIPAETVRENTPNVRR